VEGHECLITKILSSLTTSNEVEKKYGKISLRLYKNAKIKIKGKSKTASICIIELSDSRLSKTFYGLIQAILLKAKSSASDWTRPDTIENYIQDWASLFGSDQELTNQEKIGLWGELYFITQNKHLDKTVEKWHGPEQKTFDFATKSEVLDIKTGLFSSEHHFRKSQVETKQKAVFICQRIKTSQKGKDLKHFVHQIKKKLKNKELFESKLAYLGYFKALNDSSKYIVESSKWVDSKHIPQPRKIDVGVINYEFKSDVSAAPSVKRIQILKIIKRLNN